MKKIILAIVIGLTIEMISHIVHRKYGYNFYTGCLAGMPVSISIIIMTL